MFAKIKKWFADRKAEKATLKYAARLPYTAVVTNHAEHRMFSIVVKDHVFLVPHRNQHIVWYFGKALSPSTRIFNAINKKLEPEAQLHEYNSCNPQSWITSIVRRGEEK